MTDASPPQPPSSAPESQPEIAYRKELRRLRTAIFALTKSVNETSAGRKPSRRTIVALSIGAFALLALEALDVVEDVKLLSHSLAKWIGPTQVELSDAQIQSLTGQGAEARLSDEQVDMLARRVASVLADRLEGQPLVDRPLAGHDDGAAVPDHGFEPIAWVQLGSDGNWIARAIFAEGRDCPQIEVDGSSYFMQERRTFADGFFPVLVCEFLVQASEQVSLDGIGDLPIPAEDIHSILLIGDTGCRLTHYAWQGCADPKEWPFRALLEDARTQFGSTAPRGSSQHSQLIIHVGDYHYREKPCPRHRPRCGTSPSGDTWGAWYADFFDPARDALLIAPWIMLRGNHEDCERAGAGWHHFFGPTTSERAPREACREYTSPIQLKIDGGPMLLALDTASGEKMLYGEDRDTYARWRESLSAIVSKLDSEDWLWILAHQPLRTLPRSSAAATTPCNAEKHPCPKEEIQAALAKFDERARQRSVVISGDTHMFQFIHGPNEFPVTQVIAGMSGTALDPTSDFQGTWTADRRMRTAAKDGAPYYAALARFGYVVMSRSLNDSWEAKVRALTTGGTVEDAFKCTLGGVQKAAPSECESLDPSSVATSQP